MKNIKLFASGFLLALFLVFTVQVSAGIAGFKTDLIAAFAANFSAPQRQAIADSFVSAYQSEWNQRVASGTVDNNANRGIFVADKVAGYTLRFDLR